MSGVEPRTALVVGGFGGLGTAIAAALSGRGDQVLRASRHPRPDDGAVVLDEARLADLPELDVVCWAQGANVNDSVTGFTDEDLAALWEANVASVARQLRGLVVAERLRDGAALVVVSSIWQRVARPGKFSYTVTKAALGGLVRAAAMDLAPRGIRVNAVLPGVVDTAMTRAVLSPEQIATVEASTGHGRMVEASDVASAVLSLSEPTGGVTGQSVVVDLGFSDGHIF